MKIVLKKSLGDWDGVHSQYLIDIYSRYAKNDKFLDNLIQLYLSESDLQKVTSWLIKHHHDKGNTITDSQIRKLLSEVNNLEHWESKLHILQLVPKFRIDKNMSGGIETFVRQAMKSEKKFVKAAAYEAYFEIVKNIPDLQNEFYHTCEQALIDESASIKSKVRKILKELEKKQI